MVLSFVKNILAVLLLTAVTHTLPAQALYSTGLDFDNAGYEKVLKKALTRSLENLPASASVKMYAPYPKSQEAFGTCTAWASAYCGRTIVEAIKNQWTNRQYITEHAYSPAFLFRMLEPDDNICKGGSSISMAFDVLKNKGALFYNDIPGTCVPSISTSQLSAAGRGKIKDFMRLFDVNTSAHEKIEAVKKSISESKPVIFGMTCPPSFFRAQDLWEPAEQPLQSYGGHALCVVSYDDNKYGGAFEIQNSWGTSWGNQGYTWIRYEDYARFTPYAFEFVDLPEPKPQIADLSGQIKLLLSSGKEMPANLLMSARGLTVTAANITPEPLTIYRSQQSYVSGTKFRMYISNNEPAYVYALSTDLTNEITKIFPYAEGISAALTDKRNEFPFPDEDHFIEFDNNPGKDLLCVLYSKDELDINNLIQKIKAQQGTFSERIFKVIGDRITDPRNIKFSNDKIAFQGYSKGKSIIPLIVELEHK